MAAPTNKPDTEHDRICALNVRTPVSRDPANSITRNSVFHQTSICSTWISTVFRWFSFARVRRRSRAGFDHPAGIGRLDISKSGVKTLVARVIISAQAHVLRPSVDVIAFTEQLKWHKVWMKYSTITRTRSTFFTVLSRTLGLILAALEFTSSSSPGCYPTLCHSFNFSLSFLSPLPGKPTLSYLLRYPSPSRRRTFRLGCDRARRKVR